MGAAAAPEGSGAVQAGEVAGGRGLASEGTAAELLQPPPPPKAKARRAWRYFSRAAFLQPCHVWRLCARESGTSICPASRSMSRGLPAAMECLAALWTEKRFPRRYKKSHARPNLARCAPRIA